MPPMRRNNVKEKGNLKDLKYLINYLKPYYPYIITALIFAVIAAITTIIGPSKIEDLTDEMTNAVKTGVDINIDAVLNIGITLLIIYVVGAIVQYIQQFIMSTITHKTGKRLRSEINEKLNTLPLSYFDTTSRGEILSRVTNDVDTICQTLGQSIASLVNAVVLFIGVIIMMFVTSYILALTTIVCSLLGFVFVGLILKNSQKFFNAKQKYLGNMNGLIEEVYTNHNTCKAYNSIELEKNEFKEINNGLYDSNWKSQFLSGLMMPFMNFIGNLSYVLIFIVGVYLTIHTSSIGFGTIMAFTIYARLFTQPLNTISQGLTSLQQTSAATKRVFEMLGSTDMENEDEKNTKLTNVLGDIEFKNVKFRYELETPIIKDFTMSVKHGEKIAIVGPTGAGKTTMVNLLMRFYDINSGEITIDGVSINKLKREEVRKQFDMILQDTWLFEGTIRENLQYNNKCTDEELDKAVKAVGLDHLVKSLPNGYDTILSDKTALSEGQKQQLTIARAMIKNSPLLILDEATSNVDTRTEVVIQKAMDELTKGRTSFVIAHRLSTIKNADKILVMNHGDIIECGNHEELLLKKGFYYDLYNSQFETFDN